MPKGGTQIFCPKCGSNQICRAVSPTALGQGPARRLMMINHQDIRWFRRGRKCRSCGYKFLTGELDEAFINEIVNLRGAWLARVHSGVRSASRAAGKRTRIETVPLEDAQAFIRATAKWDHPSWSIVNAPGHARRIYEHPLGWAIDFGANTFLPGMAVARGFREVASIMTGITDGKVMFREDATARLKRAISGCVANQDGNEYGGYYPLDGNYLTFGTQLINASDGAELILNWGDPKQILMRRY